MRVVAGPGFHTDATGRLHYCPRLQAALFRHRRRLCAGWIPTSPMPLLAQFLLCGWRWHGGASNPWPPPITGEGRETDRIERREKNLTRKASSSRFSYNLGKINTSPHYTVKLDPQAIPTPFTHCIPFLCSVITSFLVPVFTLLATHYVLGVTPPPPKMLLTPN